MVVLDTTLSGIQKALGKKIAVHELKEALFGMGFEIDSHEGDDLKIDITPDRIDVLSTMGFARALKSYLGIAQPPQYKLAKKTSPFKVIIDQSVQQVRPHTACAVVKGLKLDEDKLKELIYVQEKLHATYAKQRKKAAIGIYPFEKINWPIRFEAKLPGDIFFQPLGAAKPMFADSILRDHPTGVQYGHLLSNAAMYPLFVDSKGVVLSMPPIINSESCGRVTTKTKDIFIEVSGFEPVMIKNTLLLITTLFSDMGGKVHPVSVEYPGKKPIIYPDFTPEKRSIQVKRICQVTGITLTAKDVGALLTKMMYTVKKVKKDAVDFLVPPFRLDIWHDVDIIDDIARAYGINNITPTLPPSMTSAQTLPATRLSDTVADLLVGLGLQEIRTFAVTDKADQFTKMGLPPSHYVALGSTADRSINMVRKALLPEVLKCLINNKNVPYPQEVFEISDVILPDEKADVRSRNVTRVCVAMCGEGKTFTNARQIIESIASALGVVPSFEACEHASFIKGRCARIIINQCDVGIIGELTPQVLQNWGLEYAVVAFEVDLDSFL